MIKREFHKHRKSSKWKKLKKKFKNFYSNFVSELKISNPVKWYSMAKRLGAEDNRKGGELSVECLKGLDNQQAAQPGLVATAAEKQASASTLEDLPTDRPLVREDVDKLISTTTTRREDDTALREQSEKTHPCCVCVCGH